MPFEILGRALLSTSRHGSGLNLTKRSLSLKIAAGLLLFSLTISIIFSNSTFENDPDLSVIISQTDGYVEVFLRADAQTLISRLGANRDPFINPDGSVDWKMVTTQTQSLMAAQLPSLKASLDGQPIDMEPMSLMLHPRDELQPFNDPIDASASIGPCGSAEVLAGRKLEDTILHVGFIVETGRNWTFNRVALPLIIAERDDKKFQVRHYVNYQYLGNDWVVASSAKSILG